MFYQVAAIATFAGLALANPAVYSADANINQAQYGAAAANAVNGANDGLVRTVTTFTTQEITVTSCAPSVTLCPAITSTTSYAVTTTIPAVQRYPLGVAGATGTGAVGAYGNGNGNGIGNGHYNRPAPTSYQGPSFTGAGNQVVAGGAVAAIGAVAALLI